MRWAVLGVALALCACSREPSFDERYSNSELEIEQRARNLDAQLNSSTAPEPPNGGSDEN